MVKKYNFGKFLPTDAVVKAVETEEGTPDVFDVKKENGKWIFSRVMEKTDRIYGLGEQVRGINKRGWIYKSCNYDNNVHTENRISLYGAHNFLLSDGAEPFGVFFDCTGEITFDVGYTDIDVLTVTVPEGFDLYVLKGDKLVDIVREFRELIGQSYIPPKWALGYTQSRWGYLCEQDIRSVVEEYKKAEIPLDAVYMDIDYMERFKDFTVSDERFPDLKKLSSDLKAEGVRLVPIIDAAVKVEKGYPVYEEGVEKGYFCKDEKGEPFVLGVWPGDSVLPDVLNPEAREWFGEKYKVLLDMGIEGFWNDMNEPATFYSKKRFASLMEDYLPEFEKKYFATKAEGLPIEDYNFFRDSVAGLSNNVGDYQDFYHTIDGKAVSHAEVHNLYGYNMTRAAAEYFKKYDPNKKFLLFSRSSSVGMHRYGGIWFGDNASWWSHILLNLKMLPAMNMCGFLYVGADLGGFMYDATEDLLLRWLSLGIFTPLMRNHSASDTRLQECYRFKNVQAFKNIIGIRYGLIPHLYGELVRCSLSGDMMFKPLSFVYTKDERAKSVEDQLLLGDSIMIAPVYEQNASGRYVYLPEKMKMIRMRSVDDYEEEILPAGDHYVKVALDEVVFFLRPEKAIPLAGFAKNVANLDEKNLRWLRFNTKPVKYSLYVGDGITVCDEKACFTEVEIPAEK